MQELYAFVGKGIFYVIQENCYMKKKTKPKKQKSIIFRLFVVGVCAYFVITLGVLWNNLRESKAQLAELNQHYAEELNTVEELKALLNQDSDAQLIEKAARERLGYAYPDEQIFIDYSGM